MKGDFHVRFCERLKLKYFGLLDPYFKTRSSQILNDAAIAASDIYRNFEPLEGLNIQQL